MQMLFFPFRSQLRSWADDVRENRKMEIIPLQIFINPTISVLDNSQVPRIYFVEYNSIL